MKKIITGVVVVVVLGVAWYGLSPLLKNKYVDDPVPSSGNMDSKSVMSNPEEDKNINADMPAPSTENDIDTKFKPVPITDTKAHPASGTVRLSQIEDKKILRYENYKTINGPDVRVYLATDVNASEFIDLGPIKGTEGNINYDIPQNTDLEKYHFALTWCEDFNVLFNSADLNKGKE